MSIDHPSINRYTGGRTDGFKDTKKKKYNQERGGLKKRKSNE